MTSMESFLFGNLWPGLLVWSVLYVSDYSMTLVCARLYRRGVIEKIEFEGSYELNPYFQADIDSLKIISPRFIAAWVISCVLLGTEWWLASLTLPQLYEFVLGIMISMELAIHVRHVRNYFLFRDINNGDSVQGRIYYPRPLILRMSSVEFFAFSALFGVLAVFTSSWFLLGGTVPCLSIALKHRKLANKHSAQTKTRAAAIQTTVKPAPTEVATGLRSS